MQEQLEELKNQNAALLLKNQQIKQDNFFLEEKIKLLEHRLYGKKSEKIKDEGPGLFNEAEVESAKDLQVSEKETITYQRAKKGQGGRRPLPANLPRIDIIHDLSPEEKICPCSAEMERIGEEISEKLRYTPAKFEVERHIRLKYACKTCEGVESEGIQPAVKIAPMPESILPKTIATVSLFTIIIINKFCDGLPFYRQEKIFMRYDIPLTRSMMARWAVMAYEKMEMLFECMREELLESHFIGIDETRVQVLKEEGKKAESDSFMWVFRGVKKDKSVTLIYLYDKSRSGRVPDEYLSDYKGGIQTDGYGGYNRLAKNPEIIRYGCWAHARRKLIEAEKAGTTSDILNELLNQIKSLYLIEDNLREKKAAPGRIEYVRLYESLPILSRIKKILSENQSRILPKSKLGDAVNYILNEWVNLERYISDGNIPIDNNLVENAIRPFVIGRKNWLFYDTPNGAYAGAAYYSLIESLKANGIEPESGLKYIFENIPSCKIKEDFKKLLPKNIDKAKVKPYRLPRSPCG